MNLSTKKLCIAALMTAVTCILAPFSIPLPFTAVPISLTNLILYISIGILGWKLSTLSYVVYLLIGLIGIPVFSNFTGGASKLFGPTGGYLIGFIFLAIVAGLIMEKGRFKLIPSLLGMTVGTAIVYLFGTVWLAFQAGMDFKTALWAGVIPFIPGDLVKMVIAVAMLLQIRKRLSFLKDMN